MAKVPFLQSAAVLVLLHANHSALANDESPQNIYSGTAELGIILTSGNTETESINGKYSIKHHGEKWDSQLKLSALKTREGSATTNEKYGILTQFDRNFSEHNYLAIVAEQQRDRFSGFKYRTTASVNLGYRLIDESNVSLDFESGPGYRRDKILNTDELVEDVILRLAGKFNWDINDGVQFAQLTTVELAEDNQTYRLETSLKSQLNGRLATKLTHKFKYVSDVPEDNKNDDSEFAVTLVYSY